WQGAPRLRAFCGGEALPWDLAETLLPRIAELWNLYGPTETTIWSTATRVLPGAGRVSLGQPIANTRLYVLHRQHRVPPGVVGELYIGGAGLARGYLNRPDLTAERFVPDPFADSPGARLYRTGDLVRYHDDGYLEYLGRIDQQVKLRGFRIELGEIEAVLRQHDAVQDALALLRDERLIAYIVEHRPDGAGLVPNLRTYLKARLPDYMIPAAFVILDALPLTAHGKLDRRALPEPDSAQPALETTFVPASTPTEEILAAIWAQVLGVAEIGIDDHFFTFGGDSIRSIQAVARARERGLACSLPQIFQYQTIRELARHLTDTAEHLTTWEPSQPFSLVSPIDRARLPQDVEDTYPLTQLQAGMLFHSEYQPDSAIYHNVNTLHLRTRFDLHAFHAAVRMLAARHPILRTAFDLTSYSEPLQLVHRQVTIPVAVDDLRGLAPAEQEALLAAHLEAEKQRTFDWTRPPLIRFQIHRRSDETFQFSWVEHHAILDGWSVASLLTELFQQYAAQPAEHHAPPSSAFRDFVALERAMLESEAAKRYWLRTLDSATISALPRLPPSTSDQPDVLSLDVPLAPEISDGLKRLARTAAVPIKSVLLAAHLRVMLLLSGTSDVLTGLVANGRPETTDGERVLGLFLNTLPFRQHLAGGSWLDLIQATFATEQELLPYRRYPMAQVQRLLGGQPLFETAFNFVHFHVYQQLQGIDGLTVLGGSSFEHTNFPFTANFSLDVATAQVRLILRCDTSIISAAQLDSMRSYYASALAAMVEQPAARYDHQSLLAPWEIEQLRTWNATRTEYAPTRSLHDLIAEQAALTPDATAVVFADQCLSYAHLDQRANQLAHHLQSLGVGPEVHVGICVERSVELVVGLLGILKAGGAYLPLDPGYPAERLQYMLAHSRAPVLLTQAALVPTLPEHSAQIVCLDADGTYLADQPTTNPSHTALPDHLAYIIYTSGSTGQPKGVLVTQHGLVNLALAQRAAFAVSPRSRVLQFASIGFDASIWEIAMALTAGATLELLPSGTPLVGADLAAFLAERGITHVTLPPAVPATLPEGELPDLDTVIVAGEACPVELVQRWATGRRFVNAYGPTEATVCATLEVLAPDAPHVSIGRPLPNTQVYVLDGQLQPVPVGVAGELSIAGAGVARGYHGRPDLTAERFVPHPFSATPGDRLYRTGDLARYLPDGRIDFLGRIDQQVKLRGFRIELGEIAAALRQYPGVDEAVLVVYDVRPGDQRLVAYLVSTLEVTITAAELRSFLHTKLPAYMVPSAFVFVPTLPLTPNGKLDRTALPVPDRALSSGGESFVAPRTPLEELITAVWAAVLGLEGVGIHDNFFALGGHSLLATQVISRLRQILAVDVPLRVLFEAPTIAALADQITGQAAVPNVPLLPQPRDGRPLPLSFAQQRLWFLQQLDPASSAYHLPTVVRLHGLLDVAALQQALTALVARHEMLRTVVAGRAGQPVQVIAPTVDVPLPVVDVPADVDDAALRALIQHAIGEPFDLQQGPLLRATLLRQHATQQILVLILHHIVSDGWSQSVLLRELTTLYRGFAQGDVLDLPPLPIQYADYALWQRQWLQDKLLEAQLSYWRQQLANVPPLDLPTDYPHPAVMTDTGAVVSVAIPAALTEALRHLSQRLGATLFMTLLAAFKVLLYRDSHQADLAVGTPIAGRVRPEL
ncbi:MAG TPA: amino acid adenylation domain-containing protein, partial [Herpetosiphonaceae bacterium]